jgi:hypothetical protein
MIGGAIFYLGVQTTAAENRSPVEPAAVKTMIEIVRRNAFPASVQAVAYRLVIEASRRTARIPREHDSMMSALFGCFKAVGG